MAGWAKWAGLVLVALVGLWGAAGEAWAGRRVALLIGNRDYEHQSVLGTPLNDINLIEKTLKDLGFDEIDKRPNLKKQDMDRAIQRFITRSSGADVAVFYYAGHGQQPFKGGRNFLLPVDARIGGDDDLETEAVLADHIVRRLEDVDKAARLRLVILDACRNNPKGWRVRADRGLAPIQTGDQFTLVGFSTNDRAPALDAVKGHPYSPYAEALARWLPRSGELPVRRIFDQTAADVRRMTDDKQMPRVSGDLPGDVLLSGQVQTDDFLAWDSARAAGSVAALEEFLKIYPASRFVAQARIQMEALKEKERKGYRQPFPRSGGNGVDEIPILIRSGVSSSTVLSGDGSSSVVNGNRFDVRDGVLYVNGTPVSGLGSSSGSRTYSISVLSSGDMEIETDGQKFSLSSKDNIK